MVIMGFIAFVVICLLVDAIIQLSRRKKAASLDASLESSGVFDENTVLIPKGLFFDKSHTWAFMGRFGDVKIGIDDFLQNVTGPITKLEMAEVGTEIKKGEKAFTIVQNGKRLDVMSPLTGKVLAANQMFKNDVSVLNTSPYNEGWIYMIEPENWLRDTQFMMMAEKAAGWIKNEFVRLKDFFAMTVASKMEAQAFVAVQDGGEIKANILSNFGPEIWEDFQINFLDKC